MMTVKEDLEQRITALPAVPPEEAYQAVMRVVGQVKDAVLLDLRKQLSTMAVDGKIDYLAALVVKHEVEAAMMDIGFKKLIADLSAPRT